MAAMMAVKREALATGAISATIRRETASGAVSAAAIATLPPMEWPMKAAGSAPMAPSVSITSAARSR